MPPTRLDAAQAWLAEQYGYVGEHWSGWFDRTWFTRAAEDLAAFAREREVMLLEQMEAEVRQLAGFSGVDGQANSWRGACNAIAHRLAQLTIAIRGENDEHGSS